MSEVPVPEMTCSKFSDFLTKEGFHEDVISSFSTNRICGTSFCNLTEADLKEMLPVIGDRARVRTLLQGVKEVLNLNILNNTNVQWFSGKPN